MMNTKRTGTILAMFFSPLLFLNAYSQTVVNNDCSVYMRYGLYEERRDSRYSSQEIYSRLFESTYDNLDEMKKMGAGMGLKIPIDGIPYDFNGSYNSESEKVKT